VSYRRQTSALRIPKEHVIFLGGGGEAQWCQGGCKSAIKLGDYVCVCVTGVRWTGQLKRGLAAVEAMKAYGGNRIIAPVILDTCWT